MSQLRMWGRITFVLTSLATATWAYPQQQVVKPVIDKEGAVHIPAIVVPYSDLASPQLRRSFIERRGNHEPRDNKEDHGPVDITKFRRQVDEALSHGRDDLLKTFRVNIVPDVIGGVQTDVVTPILGIPASDQSRVLINLHGGGMNVGARSGGQEESIPIAALGHIKVVTVDYRMAPEWHFPAASEDVAKVYRELLRSYPARNIGIYGCSSGADLAAQSVAWFQVHGLPRPGAVGMFGSGAGISDHWGDANYVSSLLMGDGAPYLFPGAVEERLNYLDGADLNDPLVTPAYDRDTLRAFPPSLLLSGTRDVGLSAVLYTHAQLVDLGVDAELHVWEGADHCSFALGEIDPDVPETQQAWKVIVNFFDKHLGRLHSAERAISRQSSNGNK